MRQDVLLDIETDPFKIGMGTGLEFLTSTLQWRHNGRDGVSNHQPHDCLLNRLFRCRSKKTSKLRATGLCPGNSPVTGEFPAQMASNAENISIWWRHHEYASGRCFLCSWLVANYPFRSELLPPKTYNYMSFLHIDMTQVVEILPQVRKKLTYSIQSISWVLMSWRRKEPRHQLQQYLLCLTGLIRSPYVKG